jgi:hypothetical protein
MAVVGSVKDTCIISRGDRGEAESAATALDKRRRVAERSAFIRESAVHIGIYLINFKKTPRSPLPRVLRVK